MSINPVYKFMSGEDKHLNALENNVAWFSNLSILNDPYEGRVAFEHASLSMDELKAMLTQIYNIDNNDLKKSRNEVERLVKKIGDIEFKKFMSKKLEDKFESFLNVHRNERFILSLSAASESLDIQFIPEPLTLMMMWGHYANGFRGLCIEFDYDKLIKSIQDLNEIKITSKKIKYIDDKLPVINSSTIAKDFMYKNGKTSMQILDAFCTKNKAWSYENEVRLISSRSGPNLYSEDSLNRIFVSNLNPNLIDRVKNILKEKTHKIKLYEVSLHKSQFGFFYKELHY